MSKLRAIGGLICALALTLAQPAAAQRSSEHAQVDLQLVLAVDVSGSVSHGRFELQKQGYAEAFRNPRVINAIRSGMTQAIAVTMTQWTGPDLQVQVVPWTVIKDEATAKAFAVAVESAPRHLFSGGTSISGAIDHAMRLMPTSPSKGLRKVIDVSGDGANNRGRPAFLARDEAVAAGVTINGLPILALEPDLDRHYWNQVVGGPGAFMIGAESYERFGEAVLKKLITEIASNER